MLLVKNAEVYAPEYLGKKDVLICGGKIEKIQDEIGSLPVECEVLDAEGKMLTPGFIDQHVHITGGGGEGSFHTRTPELQLSELVENGITTVIGLLGTDGITRSVENLYAKTKALCEEGVSAYMLTGAYGYPNPTITGEVDRDIVFIDEILGVKLAISDHRAPNVTEEEIRQDRFLKMLSLEDEQQSSTEVLKLPGSFQGRELRYHVKNEPVFLPLAGLGAVCAVLLALKDQNDIKKGENKRKHQLLLDYSEVLSRLIIFLGAGMSIRTAWDKIAFDYQKLMDDGRQKPRYAYQEMYETSCQMRGGVPEGKAFMEFGRRIGLQQYMKLGSLLEQNRKNGSKNLRDTLKVEMAEAFEQRKHQARRLGEEAGTKLLLPLFMMLSIVMVMIAVPALMEFG